MATPVTFLLPCLPVLVGEGLVFGWPVVHLVPRWYGGNHMHSYSGVGCMEQSVVPTAGVADGQKVHCESEGKMHRILIKVQAQQHRATITL